MAGELTREEHERVYMTAMAASFVLRAWDADQSGEFEKADSYRRDAFDVISRALPAGIRLSDLDITNTLDYSQAYRASITE
jgi:hypothetical protein